MHRLLMAALVVAGCNSGSGAPPPLDRCEAPILGTADTLELGGATEAELSGGPPATFTALAEGDGVALIRGNQGANMVGFVFRLTGATVPTCLGEKTTVDDSSGARVATATVPVLTHPFPDGSSITAALWMPAEWPQTFVVTVEAAGQTVTRHLHLNLIK